MHQLTAAVVQLCRAAKPDSSVKEKTAVWCIGITGDKYVAAKDADKRQAEIVIEVDGALYDQLHKYANQLGLKVEEVSRLILTMYVAGKLVESSKQKPAKTKPLK
jgi:hypothetical protein